MLGITSITGVTKLFFEKWVNYSPQLILVSLELILWGINGVQNHEKHTGCEGPWQQLRSSSPHFYVFWNMQHQTSVRVVKHVYFVPNNDGVRRILKVSLRGFHYCCLVTPSLRSKHMMSNYVKWWCGWFISLCTTVAARFVGGRQMKRMWNQPVHRSRKACGTGWHE